MGRIVWVAPKESPYEIPSGTQGFVTSKGTIYLVKGRADEHVKEHEKAHIELGHYTKSPRFPHTFIGQELDADILTYKKMGRPVGLKQTLRALLVELREEWKMGPKEAFRLVRDEMDKRSNYIPSRWFKDLEGLKRGYRVGEERHIKEVEDV